ncbi:MAG: hypothetical protein MI743_03390 [Sneathiellales bacterium]|nr:hypothetical protein [Sneathiellales bacterium]
MPDRKTPVSLRISQSDVEFIASLQIKGASTPSEKIRALIKEAREQHEKNRDYRSVLQEVEGRVLSVVDQVKNWEHTRKTHSELIVLFAEWLPEVEAEFLTSLQNKEENEKAYQELEDALTDRMSRLFERMLRLLVVPDGALYSTETLSRRMEPVLELARIVEKQRKE